MTTTVCITPLDEGAPQLCDGALDPFRGLRQLLPKLAKPSWVRLIKSPTHKPKAPAQTTEVQRVLRRNARKVDRFARAMSGEFTRSRSAAA